MVRMRLSELRNSTPQDGGGSARPAISHHAPFRRSKSRQIRTAPTGRVSSAMRDPSNESHPSAPHRANGEERITQEVAALRRENDLLRAQLQTMVENEPECVKLVDKDGRLVAMNAAGLAMLEAHSLAEVQARPLIDFVAPEYREAFNDLHRRVLNGKSGTLQFAVSGLRGGRRWLEAHAAPQRDGTGRTVGVLAVTRDLTDKHQIESALSDAEVRLRLALRAGEIGTWDWDLASGRIVWSEIHERIWGMPAGTFTGTYEEFENRIHPADRPTVNLLVQDAIARAQGFALEFRVVWPNGTVRWVAGQAEVFRGANGSPERVTGVVVDITARRQAVAALRASQEKLATAFRTSPVAIVITRMSDARVLEVNPAFESMIGRAATEIVGRTLRESGIVSDATLCERRLEELARTGTLPAGEVELQRKDGERRTVLAAAEVVEIDGIACIVETAHDITETRQSVEAGRDAQQRFRCLAENIREVFWIAGRDGTRKFSSC